MNSSLIVLDADGVLVDYHEGYARAFEKAFGIRPKVRDPQGYHPRHYWDVPELTLEERQHLHEHGFVDEIWRTMPVLPGVVEACELLRQAGYSLRCVTALRPKFEEARAANLHAHGLRLESVHAVGPNFEGNPKLGLITQMEPAAFVDDLLPYLQGIAGETWRALIDGRPNNSPNHDPLLEAPHSRHINLLDFARFWTARRA